MGHKIQLEPAIGRDLVHIHQIPTNLNRYNSKLFIYILLYPPAGRGTRSSFCSLSRGRHRRRRNRVGWSRSGRRGQSPGRGGPARGTHAKFDIKIHVFFKKNMTFSISTSFGSSHDMVVDGNESRLTIHIGTAEFLFSRPCNRYLFSKPPCLLILCSVQMSKSDRYQNLIQAKIKKITSGLFTTKREGARPRK